MVTGIKTICPQCKVSWDVLAEMLNEPDELVTTNGLTNWLENENRTIARRLIESCKACSEHFGGQL